MAYEQIVDTSLQAIPQQIRDNVRNDIALLAQSFDTRNILTPNVFAYALATTQLETAGNFKPINEFGDDNYFFRMYDIQGERPKVAMDLGNTQPGDGIKYHGRGFIQLTGRDNYTKIGEKLGLGNKLAENPDLVLQPEIAAEAMAQFFKDKGVAQLAEKGNFINARGPVNANDKAGLIAEYANNFLSKLKQVPEEIWKNPKGTTQDLTKKQIPQENLPKIAPEKNALSSAQLKPKPTDFSEMVSRQQQQPMPAPAPSPFVPFQNQMGKQLPADNKVSSPGLLSQRSRDIAMGGPVYKQPQNPITNTFLNQPQTQRTRVPSPTLANVVDQSFNNKMVTQQPFMQNYSIMASPPPTPAPTMASNNFSSPGSNFSAPASNYTAPANMGGGGGGGGTVWTVQPGNTLSQIAQAVLGDASRYRELSGYRSGNPNLIYPGEQIRVG